MKKTTAEDNEKIMLKQYKSKKEIRFVGKSMRKQIKKR